MDPTALYYALSTIAQCAAALAALIGFLGLWRLDRLKQERAQAIQIIDRQLDLASQITGLGSDIAREILAFPIYAVGVCSCGFPAYSL
jgi:hypothetical protein